MARLSVKSLYVCASAFALLGVTYAHGGTGQKPIKADPNAPWAVRHMQEEHHMNYFDNSAFFTLHDFDDNGQWDGAEIQKFYGLEDESAKDVTYEKRHEVVDKIMELMDHNDDGMVSKDEWLNFSESGQQLPDFGLGPGHHWDMETEYEIHHWERYHDENTKEEDLTHPEDIAHFKKHDELEDEEEAQRKLDAQAVVEHNIPMKFIRHTS